MKRLFLALGIGAAALAISTPASAQTGCRWYDVNCRLATGDVRTGDVRTTGRTVDGSWQLIGRDANGNAIYQRRRIDGNGNVVIERARRDALGRMVIIDRDIDNRSNRNNRNNRNVNNTRRYEKNGMICTYKENSEGYKEHCKYRKNKSGGLYRINDIYRDGVYRGDDDDWDDDDDRSNRIYRTNKVRGDKYRTTSVNRIYGTTVNGDKYKVGKANSNKYNKYNKYNKSNSAKYNRSNGKAKGHDKD